MVLKFFLFTPSHGGGKFLELPSRDVHVFPAFFFCYHFFFKNINLVFGSLKLLFFTYSIQVLFLLISMEDRRHICKCSLAPSDWGAIVKDCTPSSIESSFQKDRGKLPGFTSICSSLSKMNKGKMDKGKLLAI